jgi:phosphoribosylformylglycinamidine synthase I
MKAKFLVLSGDGINCENETARAIEQAGGHADKIHVNELISQKNKILDYQGFVIPGGFSFGDHLSSGQILSLKLEQNIGDELLRFCETGVVLGVCNGFQTLTKMGLLPHPTFKRSCVLLKNEQGHFVDRWVNVKVNSASPCVWTKNLPQEFALPIRHGEGRFILENETALQNLKQKQQVVLNYSEDVNGSTENIAGICDESGRIFALMPHPEAAVYDWQMPFSGKAQGHLFFNNAINYCRES